MCTLECKPVWKETVVARFKVRVLFQHLTGETKKNRETSINIADLRTEIRNLDLPNIELDVTYG
jgi:hypothetical protein